MWAKRRRTLGLYAVGTQEKETEAMTEIRLAYLGAQRVRLFRLGHPGDRRVKGEWFDLSVEEVQEVVKFLREQHAPGGNGHA